LNKVKLRSAYTLYTMAAAPLRWSWLGDWTSGG